ncbi:MAG: beta-N-acetylglucosaminidase domain-containing protein [Paramuribaculum sp.]|nr:beta-N-acetylglucosaminidase domain-containing protein [Paramuribaculum sp.]
MKLLNFAAVAAAVAVAVPAATAQNDFDFSTQRGEIQVVQPVPGKVIDRGVMGTVINPVPRKMTMSDTESILLGNKLRLSVPKALDYAVPAVPAHPGVVNVETNGAKLSVVVNAKAATKAGVPDSNDAYRLVIDAKGITITARTNRGALYGLYTLGQIFDGPWGKLNRAPYCDITDWPEFPHRGLVEGFYGTPWSHEARLAIIDYLGKNKMNTYIYGPKDDPYHSSPNWRQPYPEAEAAKIKELARRAQDAGVDFVWAIHPGKDIRWNKEDYDSLVNKFELMYKLGVRGYAVFFDDIEGEGTNPRRQTELLNALNRDFVSKKGDVAPLAVCPTEYSRLWASPKKGGANDIYGETLDKDINVFYTGDVVCSDLTKETLGFMNNLIRRPAYFWWNFPVSDYCRNFLLEGPVYGLETDLTAADCVGVLSNPMEHGIASLSALYSVGDYNWNPGAYNAMDSWVRSLADVAGPEAAKAYHDFAINSADTRTGYRRDESWEMPRITDVNNISDADRATLRRLFNELRYAPGTLRAKSTNPALVAELEPWLVQAEALGKRLIAALDLVEPGAEAASEADRWDAIAAAVATPEEEAAYNAHILGTLRLLPFHAAVTENASRDFYTRIAGHAPVVRRFAGTYHNLSTGEPMAMMDGDTTTYYHSNNGQRNGDRIIIDLGETVPVSEIYFLQGRNEGDVDYFDAFTLEVSPDDENWTLLTPQPVKETYEYTWKGEPVTGRYLRIRRDDSSKRTNWTAIREIAVNPVTLEQRGLASASGKALPASWGRAIDNNPTTGITLGDETIVYTLPADASAVTILTDKNGAAATATWLDASGNAMSTVPVNRTLTTLTAPEGAKSVSLKGRAVIQELIAR